MPDEITAVAPTVVPPTSAAPIAPTEQEPAWLPERLNRARATGRSEAFAEIGVADAKAHKAAEVERQTAHLAQVKDLQDALASHALASMSDLTEEQRAAVTSIAGTDPKAQLKTISALRVAKVFAAPASQVPTAATSPAPPPPPVNTAATTAAPTPLSPAAINHLAIWEQLQKTNPMRAANYLLKYQREVSTQRAAFTKT